MHTEALVASITYDVPAPQTKPIRSEEGGISPEESEVQSEAFLGGGGQGRLLSCLEIPPGLG